MLAHCCNRLFVAFALPKSLCRLIDHKHPLLLLLHPFHTLFANCIFGMDIPPFLIDTHTFTYAWLSLTEIMLPQMCELLMSFSQLATWAILPVCSWQFAAVARCRFFKFFMLQFSQIPRALHVLEHMCVTLCACVCVCVHFNNIYLANVAFQMQQQQQLHICTASAASQSRFENWEMDTTKSECGSNFTERNCLLCHIQTNTYIHVCYYIELAGIAARRTCLAAT